MRFKRQCSLNVKKQYAPEAADDVPTQKKMFAALFFTAETVSNRNPQSRGQGLRGESKVAILQLLQDGNEHHQE